jgi:hypothetical protein
VKSYAYHVCISHGEQLTDCSREARFFLEPINPLHRQYEALRAYFIEGLPSPEAARRFGYSPGAFRVLCHQFRRAEDLQERFFREIRHGPHTAHRHAIQSGIWSWLYATWISTRGH